MIVRLLRALRSRYLLWKDPIAYARSIGVTVGQGCRFAGLQHGAFGSEPYLVKIGHKVGIAAQAQFLTHDGGIWTIHEQYPDLDVVAPIIIEDRVLIGTRAMILPGVRVGENSIVGAGAIVTHDIPPNSVAAGCPARVVCSKEEYIKKVLKKATPTAHLSATEKREYYLKKFNFR